MKKFSLLINCEWSLCVFDNFVVSHTSYPQEYSFTYKSVRYQKFYVDKLIPTCAVTVLKVSPPPHPLIMRVSNFRLSGKYDWIWKVGIAQPLSSNSSAPQRRQKLHNIIWDKPVQSQQRCEPPIFTKKKPTTKEKNVIVTQPLFLGSSAPQGGQNGITWIEYLSHLHVGRYLLFFKIRNSPIGTMKTLNIKKICI